VLRSDARNLDEVKALLDAVPGPDTYVMVAGVARELYRNDATPLSPNGGIAPSDPGNRETNLAFSWADALVGRNDESDNGPSASPLGLALNIAHEVGHTLGLRHVECSSRPEDPQGSLGCIDVMAYGGDSSAVFSRLDLDQAESNGTQNSYEVLARDIGRRPAAPGYVSGSGLHGEVLIDGSTWGEAFVEVRSFADPERRTLVKTFTLNVRDAARGLVVEGGQGNDRVELRSFGLPAELRGGKGDDELLGGSGADVLVGGLGDDRLSGGAGNDRFVFSWDAFPKILGGGSPPAGDSLGADVVIGGTGSDTLDLASYRRPVRVDLDEPGPQWVDRVPPLVDPRLPYRPFGGTTPPDPRLSLELPDLFFRSFSLGPQVENVTGTAFRDDLRGNELANVLLGGAGDDGLDGGPGSDTLNGGAGYDVCLADPSDRPRKACEAP
jgi:hypothetical protein